MVFQMKFFIFFILLCSKLIYCSTESNPQNGYLMKCQKNSAATNDNSLILLIEKSSYTKKCFETFDKQSNKVVKVDLSNCTIGNFSLRSLKDSLCRSKANLCNNSFEFLETLNISSNFLTSLSFDLPLPHLKVLDLSNNFLPELPLNLFEQSTNLEYLDFSGNYLEYLNKKAFEYVQNVQSLLINNQKNLVKIHHNTFDDLVKLRRLSMNSCTNLQEIPQDIFKNTKNLQFLDLQHNSLSNLRFLTHLNTNDLQLLLEGNNFNCGCNDLTNIEKLENQKNIQRFTCLNLKVLQNERVSIKNIIKNLTFQCFYSFENSRKTFETTLKINFPGSISCGINPYLFIAHKHFIFKDTSKTSNTSRADGNSTYILGRVTWYIKRTKMKLTREIVLKNKDAIETNEKHKDTTDSRVKLDNSIAETNITILSDGNLYIPSVKAINTGTYHCDFEILSINHPPFYVTPKDHTEKIHNQPEIKTRTNNNPTQQDIYITYPYLNTLMGLRKNTSEIKVLLDYSALHRAVYESICVGIITVAFIFVISVIVGASRYLFNTCNKRAKAKKQDIVEVIEKLNGYKCAQVDKFLAYRNVQMDKLFAFTSATKDHLFAFRVSKIDKLRTHKQCTITSILHQLDRMKVHYIVQSAKVKDNCGQQVEKLRESYEFGRGRIRKYGSEKVERMRETYNCQVYRVKEYGTDQMRRLRIQYKTQQQCLMKLMQLINAGHCASVIEEDCIKTESEIFDEEVQVFLDEDGVGGEDEGDEDVFEDDEVEMELARSISEIERICSEGIQKSEEHFAEALHLSCDCKRSSSSSESVVDCNYISPALRKKRKRNKSYNNEKQTATSAEITSLNGSNNFSSFNDVFNNIKSRPLSFDNSATPSSERQKSFAPRKIKSLQLNELSKNNNQSSSFSLSPLNST